MTDLKQLRAKAETELPRSQFYNALEFSTIYGPNTATYITAAKPSVVIELIDRIEHCEFLLERIASFRLAKQVTKEDLCRLASKAAREVTGE